MNLPGFFRESISDIFAIADNRLYQLPVKRHGLRADRHQGGTLAQIGRFRIGAFLLARIGGNRYCRGNAVNIMAIALGAANQMTFNLIIKVICATKPAFKFVIVIAAEVVDDHVFNLGARDGNRTRTLKEREILSLLCLPISPPGLG